MRADIEALAQRGQPSVSRLVEQGGEIDFADIAYQIPVYTDREAAVASLVATDCLGLIAWLFKPALIAALDAEIIAESDDKAALGERERADKLAQIETDILEHERIESALVWQAQAAGIGIEHRPDISPLALLGLKLVTAPRAERAGSSPEHVIRFAGDR